MFCQLGRASLAVGLYWVAGLSTNHNVKGEIWLYGYFASKNKV